MNLRFSATVAILMMAGSAAVAAPVVTGNIISWPDDGWYQVLSKPAYKEVCGGTRSCEVTPGAYVVINHTIGKRFENVVVKGDTGTDSAVVVTGNTISWPDDGWYQVQSATTYASLCEGGRACDVPAGEYNVINHTTGQRFENIEVAGTAVPAPAPAPNSSFNLADVSQELIVAMAGYQLDQLALVVDDLAYGIAQTTTITWADTSWYQVQKPETFQSVCNGGAQCQLLPGSYVVINHTTGARETLDIPFVTLEEQANVSQLPGSTYSLNDQDGNAVTVDVNHFHYSCEGGGSLVRKQGIQELQLGSFLRMGLIERNGYAFDQCKITVRDGLLPAGNYELNGSLNTDLRRPFAGFGDHSGEYIFSSFSITSDNGTAYQVDGKTDHYFLEGSLNLYQRHADITQYRKQASSIDVDEVLANVTFSKSGESEIGIRADDISVQGTISSEKTAGQSVSVTTESPLAFKWVFPNNTRVEPVDHAGVVNMSADDGSLLSIRGNAFAPGFFFQELPLVDLEYTKANGDQSEINGVELGYIQESEPNCFMGPFFRNEQTKRLECIIGELAAP